MRISGIIHQQICQLKWHLLACFGLVMVLPIEEAIINLKVGDGFFSGSMAYPPVLFGPLLAGLIACANVQGDLNQKLYIFWRSKPANINLLITLKFFIGLIGSLIIIACPLAFYLFGSIIWDKHGVDGMFFKYHVPPFIMIAIMIYSLCFASNVLVRKTARSWLIGILIGFFLLVLPFMLPLNYKDLLTDLTTLAVGFFFGLTLLVSAAAFIFSLFAAKYDWYLRTNLKWILWAVAGLVFVLLMLFSSQVANIKILQEKEVENFGGHSSSIENIGGKLLLESQNYVYGRNYIDIKDNKINLSEIGIEESDYTTAYMVKDIEGYYVKRYPEKGLLYKNIKDDMYSFSVHAYCRDVMEGHIRETLCDMVYLKCHRDDEKKWIQVSELDISDCLAGYKRGVRMTMRLIDEKLIVCVNYSYIVLDVTDPKELKLIDKKFDVLKKFKPFSYKDSEEDFDIPLIPIKEISLEERIRFSIDLNYRYYYETNNIYESSIVDINDDKFAFFLIDFDAVFRFDVTGCDDKKIYCRFNNSRPFTFLESMTTFKNFRYHSFVKNGKLYSYENDTLMVFDIRSNQRIRKLGHFIRKDYEIQDIEVLENSNILAGMRWDPVNFSSKHLERRKYYLYLLKNPE